MKKNLIIIGILLLTSFQVIGQGNAILGQYFQTLPVFNPSFAGANDFLDIRTGFRKQWAGFAESPATGFLSVYSPINTNFRPASQNSLRASKNPHFYKGGKTETGRVKLGVGGYVLVDNQGPFVENDYIGSFSVHVPIKEGTFLSLGTSFGISSARIDFARITLEDEINDPTFNALINNGGANIFSSISAGLGLYSESYYFGYSTHQLSRKLISGNDDVNNEGANIRHHILAGYRFFLSYKWELIPNTFFRIGGSQPLFFEVGGRIRYQKRISVGLSFRNDETYVANFGMELNDTFNFGYSFDFKNTDFNNFNSGSHEVIIGIRLFNNSKYTSFW